MWQRWNGVSKANEKMFCTLVTCCFLYCYDNTRHWKRGGGEGWKCTPCETGCSEVFGMPAVWCQPPVVGWCLSARLHPSVHPARHCVTEKGPSLTESQLCSSSVQGRTLCRTSKPNWAFKIHCQTRHHCEERKANPCMIICCCSADYGVNGMWTLVQNYNVTHSRRPKVTPKGWCSLLDAPPILSLFCLPSCSRWHIWNCAFAYQGTTPYDVWSVLGFAFAQGMPKTWFMHGFARRGKSF